MTTPLQQVITAARALSPRDKLELLEIISHDLQQTYAFAEESAVFWSPRSIDELVQAQTAPVITPSRWLNAKPFGDPLSPQ
jgi:hypothetical protein